MKKMMLRAALLSCAALAVSPVLANHSWGSYHWGRTSNPAKLRVNKALTGTWGSYADIAIGEWDASSKLDLYTYAPTNVSVSRKKCSPIANQVLVCNDTYGQRGWLGIASIWASGNHITQATTKINDTYFNMPQYSSPGWRRLVMCQEVGHDFGLAHQDENFTNQNLGSCMDYTNNPDAAGAQGEPNNWSPDSHDMAQLDTIYSHTDPTSTDTRVAASSNFGVRDVGKPAAPAVVSEGAGDSPAEWGRAIGTDGQGRPNLYVQDLGGGRRKITHVFWAIGEGPRGGHHD